MEKSGGLKICQNPFAVLRQKDLKGGGKFKVKNNFVAAPLMVHPFLVFFSRKKGFFLKGVIPQPV